jgi:ribosomal protein S18 acetylase RimI-like enzyme
MAQRLRIRRYEADDADAVWELHERAMADAGTDPSAIPGTDDVRRVEEAYLAVGGEFLVGVLPGADGPAPGSGDEPALSVEDDALVAMGGFLPTEAGHEDERSVPGAAELHRMRVAPAHQRRGYGRRLLDGLESRAREAGFERLLATARRQRSAVRFYAGEGYARTGTSTYGEYELVHFEKRL